MPFIEAGGLVTHYDLTGPAGAETILFANSLGTDLRVWDAVAASLATRYRVLRYDMRGHGLTDCPPVADDAVGYSMQDLAGDALALLDGLGIARVHGCGLSIGGMVVQKLTSLAPDRVASVMLCDTGSRIGTPEMWDQRSRGIRQGGLAAIADGILARWFTETFRADKRMALRYYRNMLERTPADGYVGCCGAIRNTDLAREAAAIRVPTLVMVGDQDLATPPAQAAELAKSIPGARLEVIKQAGHIPCVEQSERVVALIESFLASLAGEAADRYVSGMKVRRAVLGDEHVDRATARITDLDKEFQGFITRYAWGEVWGRPGLDRKTRSMLTIALLAGLGHHDEVKMHVKATRNTGVTPEQVAEVLLQVAIYAGVPAANSAFRLAKEAYEEIKGESAKS
jgi:3-oxoadipate enol-lactonase/4-carboxymuconolactone decarboxylase